MRVVCVCACEFTCECVFICVLLPPELHIQTHNTYKHVEYETGGKLTVVDRERRRC